MTRRRDVPVFPERLFVKTEDCHFVAASDPLYLAKIGEAAKLGVYRLVEEGEVTGAVTYRSTRKVEDAGQR